MPQLSAPVKELLARLAYHTLVGQTPKRLLDGWKFDPIPSSDVEGLKDLPGIRIYVPDGKGDYHPARNEKASLKFRMCIATKRALGLVAHMEAVELVMDALNFDTTGKLNPAIVGTAKPWSWDTADNFIVDSSVNSQVSISLEPKVVELGKRRL